MYYLWVYFDNRVKDFFLPNAPNWTGELVLQQADTGWAADVVIPVRALDGKWFIRRADRYRWAKLPLNTEEVEMGDGQRYLMMNGSRSIGIVIDLYEGQSTVFKKYGDSRERG